jgi:hypothetical protein
MGPLPGAASQVRALAAALADPAGCALHGSNIEIIGVSGAPTTAEIIDVVTRSVARATPTDAVLVYFAGHAFHDQDPDGEIYFCGRDARLSSLSETALSATALASIFGSCKARGILLILDCCVSAGLAENAPAFFRRLGTAEFRIVIAASRADERSWELPDGRGTLFSKQLIAVLTGDTPVGTVPGQIRLSGLVDAIDFGLNEDLHALHPDVPLQQPVFAGSYERDPLLFVHKGNQAAGFVDASGRISRRLHKRRLRMLAIGLGGSVVFATMSYLTFVDGTRYAGALDASTVEIMRGHPELGAPAYPRLIVEYSLSAQALKSDSPLRRGGTVIALPGRSISDAVDAELNDVGSAGKLIVEGKTAEARERLLALLADTSLDNQQAHFVRVMFPAVATEEDVGKLVKLTAAQRPEVRSAALGGLLRLSPSTAFTKMTSALSDAERFDQRALMYHIAPGCRQGASEYLAAATASPIFNGVYPRLLDVVSHVGCRLNSQAIYHLMEFWPTYQLGDLARYAELFGVGPPRLEDLAFPDRLIDLALFRVDGSDPNCMEFVARMLSTSESALQKDELALMLTSEACRQQLKMTATFEGTTRVLHLRSTEADMADIGVDIDSSARAGLAGPLFDALSGWLRADDKASADAVSAFLSEVGNGGGDQSTRALALEALRAGEVNVPPPADALTSNLVELRKAAFGLLDAKSPEVAHNTLLSRIGDSDFVEWPETFGRSTVSDTEFADLRKLIFSGAPIRERAAAALTMAGNIDDLIALSNHPENDVRGALADYLAARGDLSVLESAEPTTSELAPFVPSLLTLVKKARAEHDNLTTDLASVPERLRTWRARQILDSRGDAFDVNFARVLSPGSRVWLERFVLREAEWPGRPSS